MGKRIIVLSDGTGNAAAKVWRTNVWRLFESIDLKQSDQVAAYDDGVGTSSFKPWALISGAFGFGLKRNVLSLYKFLCRNYRSKKNYEDQAKLNIRPYQEIEKGQAREAGEEFQDDEIFLFGFSRGAFTVRMLAGLVLDQGLVTHTSEYELDQKARAAFRAYRNNRYPGKNLAYPFRRLVDWVSAYKHSGIERKVEHIRFIGVWDTVAAYGAPVDEITRGFNKYIWPLELPDSKLPEGVLCARQALAIDEERTTFAPVLWEETDTSVPGKTYGETLVQAWFAGVHANVGGGYPDDSLAKVSLNWMMDEAAKCHLRFKTSPDADPDAIKHTASSQDKDGRLYDSRAGLGGYYRYGPRKISDFYQYPDKRKLTPKIHESALARIQVGAHFYAPIGLPPDYAVVKDGGDIVRLGPTTFEDRDSAAARHKEQEGIWNIVWRRRAIYFLTVFCSLYVLIYPLIRESYAFQEMATRLRIVSDAIKLVGLALPSGADRWIQGYSRDPAWFLIWIGIVGFFIWYGSTLKSDINSRMRRIWNARIERRKQPEIADTATRFSRVAWAAFITLLTFLAVYPLLPLHDFAKTRDWGDDFRQGANLFNNIINAYTERPLRWVIWAFLIFHFFPDRAIEVMRTSKPYIKTLRFLKYHAAPAVLAIFIVYFAVAFSSHFLFDLRDSFGAFCKHNTDERGPLNAGNNGFRYLDGKFRKRDIPLDISKTDDASLCVPTKVFAVRGQKYAISVVRDPADRKWKFWNTDSFMSGQPIYKQDWWKQPVLALMFPLRRTWNRPWNSVIVRYGPTGHEESFLDREPPALDDELVDEPDYKAEEVPGDEEVLSEGWTAKRDGEIYLYVNKPVIGIWGLENLLGKVFSSEGKAKVSIERRS